MPEFWHGCLNGCVHINTQGIPSLASVHGQFNVQAGFNNCQLICVVAMLGNGQVLIKHKGKKHVASKLFELLTGCKKTS